MSANRSYQYFEKLGYVGVKSFQEKILEIFFGKTRSYIEIARAIRSPLAARAVGQALGRNPLPILIPCHRVLRHNQELGGFSAGLNRKQYLLQLEGRL